MLNGYIIFFKVILFVVMFKVDVIDLCFISTKKTLFIIIIELHNKTQLCVIISYPRHKIRKDIKT